MRDAREKPPEAWGVVREGEPDAGGIHKLGIEGAVPCRR